MKHLYILPVLLLSAVTVPAQSCPGRNDIPEEGVPVFSPADTLHPVAREIISSSGTAADMDPDWTNEKNVSPLSYFLPSGKTDPPITQAPANDNICGAIALTNHDCYPRNAANWVWYSNAAATWENPPALPGCWQYANGWTLWFKFIANTTAQLVTTDWYYGGGGTTDNQIAVYSSSNNACNGVLTLIGCNEDIAPSGNIAGNNDQYIPDYFAGVTVTGLTPGNTYFVRVDGYYNSCFPFFCPAQGYIVLCTEPAPANDACSTAQPAVLNTVYAVNNTGAGPFSNNNVADKAFTCGSTENMLYYTFTPAVTDLYYINQWAQTCDYNRGTQFIVYKSAYNCATLPAATGSANSTYELFCSAQSTANRNMSFNLTGGQTYYIVIDGGAGDECTFNWAITQAAPLPVELLNFSAVCEDPGGRVRIEWSTASENNNDHFLVERSKEGTRWEPVATVKGAGNSSTVQYYFAEDNTPYERIPSYYRLSQIDHNGSTKVFNPTMVSCAEGSMYIYNADGAIYLSFTSYAEEQYSISLFDPLGQKISGENIMLPAGKNEIKLFEGMIPGIYFITVMEGGQSLFTKKAVVSTR